LPHFEGLVVDRGNCAIHQSRQYMRVQRLRWSSTARGLRKSSSTKPGTITNRIKRSISLPLHKVQLPHHQSRDYAAFTYLPSLGGRVCPWRPGMPTYYGYYEGLNPGLGVFWAPCKLRPYSSLNMDTRPVFPFRSALIGCRMP
jgi:hypothetical protein